MIYTLQSAHRDERALCASMLAVPDMTVADALAAVAYAAEHDAQQAERDLITRTEKGTP